MKINLDIPLVLADGTKVVVSTDGPTLRLGEALRGQLNSISKDDPQVSRLTPEDIMRRGKLAMAIAKGGHQEFELKDITFMQDLVLRGFGPKMPELATIIHQMLEAPTEGQGNE